MTDEERDNKINAIYNVLMGVDGYPGLAKRFEELASSHYRLKRLAYSVFFFLLGSGVLGGSAIALVQAIKSSS